MTAAQHLGDLVLLRGVRDRIDREYAQPLDLEALARGVNMTAEQLGREFQLAYGTSPYDHLMIRRIACATALLGHTHLSISEVSSAVGCSSPETFSARFTEFIGLSPGAYRRAETAATTSVGAASGRRGTRPSRNREAPVLACT